MVPAEVQLRVGDAPLGAFDHLAFDKAERPREPFQGGRRVVVGELGEDVRRATCGVWDHRASPSSVARGGYDSGSVLSWTNVTRRTLRDRCFSCEHGDVADTSACLPAVCVQASDPTPPDCRFGRRLSDKSRSRARRPVSPRPIRLETCSKALRTRLWTSPISTAASGSIYPTASTISSSGQGVRRSQDGRRRSRPLEHTRCLTQLCRFSTRFPYRLESADRVFGIATSRHSSLCGSARRGRIRCRRREL